MNVLHVSDIDTSPYDGMSVVIPDYIRSQSKFANVHLLNLSNDNINLNSDLFMPMAEFKDMGFEGLLNKWGIPDLVVFHGIYLPTIWKFYRKYIRNKYKYVILPHGSMSVTSQSKSKIKKKLANKLVITPWARDASAVQFLSEYEHKNADKRLYKNYIVHGNGIYPQTRYNCTGIDGKIIFTYIGRLRCLHKGLDLLVEAINSIKNESPDLDFKVDLYGPDGEGTVDYLNSKIKEYSIDNILFVHDPVVGKEKENIITKKTDFFIMPSRSEGMPMGLLEALSYGTPVIVTPGTGFAEEVDQYHCGYTMQATPESIAAAMQRAYAEIKSPDGIENYKKMQQNALKCVEKYYWSNIARETINDYIKIIED